MAADFLTVVFFTAGLASSAFADALAGFFLTGAFFTSVSGASAFSAFDFGAVIFKDAYLVVGFFGAVFFAAGISSSMFSAGLK